MRGYMVVPIITQTLLRYPMIALLKMCARFTVNGAERVAQFDSPAFFAVSHASELDPFVVESAIPFSRHTRPLIFVAGDKSFYRHMSWMRRLLYGGWIFRIVGAFPFRGKTGNYRKSLEFFIGAIEDGCSILIFPEGGRTKDGALQEAHGGVAYMSRVSGAPVFPVLVEGTYRLSFFSLVSRAHSICVTFGDPIFFPDDGEDDEGKRSDQYKRMAAEIMRRIALLHRGREKPFA